MVFVDLPGYGYAKAPKHEQQRWARMIENYLIERENLELVLLLVDGGVNYLDAGEVWHLLDQRFDMFLRKSVRINKN